MQSHQPEGELTQDLLDNYAFQAAMFQDKMDELHIPIEHELSVPRLLFGALGPRNARLVTERMVELRKDPEERSRAEEAAQRVWEAFQAKHK